MNEWHRSAAEAAILAMERWIRVKANMPLGAYDIFEVSSTIRTPNGRACRSRICFALRSAIGSSIA